MSCKDWKETTTINLLNVTFFLFFLQPNTFFSIFLKVANSYGTLKYLLLFLLNMRFVRTRPEAGVSNMWPIGAL